MMSLYKRNNVYWSRIMHRGTVTRRSLRVRSAKEARALEAALRLRIVREEAGLKEIPTFEDFCTDFLNYVAKRTKRETYRAYTNAVMQLKKLPEFASCRLDKIDGALMDRFVALCSTKGQAIATINLRIRVVRRILHFAAERGIITKVPRLHGLKGENQREYVISEADEQRLIDTVDHPTMKLLLPFLIDTGLRISEACNLTWADVTETSLSVREGKTKFARRTVPLTRRAAEILSTLGRESNGAAAPLFTRHFGAISPVWATQHFVRARRKIGLPDGCVLHSTRHTFCSRLGKSGASPFELQRLAGHSNIQISARYCHPDTEQLTSAINRLNRGEK